MDTKGSNENVKSKISFCGITVVNTIHTRAFMTLATSTSSHIHGHGLMRKISPNIIFNASVCHIFGKRYNEYRKSIKEAMSLNCKFPDKNVQLSKSHVGSTLPAFPLSIQGIFFVKLMVVLSD